MKAVDGEARYCGDERYEVHGERDDIVEWYLLVDDNSVDEVSGQHIQAAHEAGRWARCVITTELNDCQLSQQFKVTADGRLGSYFLNALRLDDNLPVLYPGTNGDSWYGPGAVHEIPAAGLLGNK